MSRIATNGRAWHDPVGGTTAWQRERWTSWEKGRTALRRATWADCLVLALFAIAFCSLVLA